MCGEASAVDIVEELAQKMGDAFEVRHYHRLTDLTVLNVGLGKSTTFVDLFQHKILSRFLPLAIAVPL